jgi:hypothetical protein
VAADVAIDLPRPRNAEMKLSEGFSRYRREILGLLQGSVRDTGQFPVTVSIV